jgi:hypothetical protein
MDTSGWKIHWWHGIDRNHSEFKRAASLCEIRGSDLYWTGNLDEFAKAWGQKFLVLPAVEGCNGNCICVTQFNSFSAR